MNSVEQHAVSLAVDNEETEGFTVNSYMYALSRYHGSRAATEAVERLLERNILRSNGRVIFLTDPEDWNEDE